MCANKQLGQNQNTGQQRCAPLARWASVLPIKSSWPLPAEEVSSDLALSPTLSNQWTKGTRHNKRLIASITPGQGGACLIFSCVANPQLRFDEVTVRNLHLPTRSSPSQTGDVAAFQRLLPPTQTKTNDRLGLGPIDRSRWSIAADAPHVSRSEGSIQTHPPSMVRCAFFKKLRLPFDSVKAMQNKPARPQSGHQAVDVGKNQIESTTAMR